MTARAFYILRHGLVNHLDLAHKHIRPATATETLFPPETRKRSWKTLADTLNLRFPRLAAPHWLTCLEALFVILPSIYLFTLISTAALPVVIVYTVVCLKWIFPHKGRFFVLDVPSNSHTIGDLAKSLLTLNYGKIAGPDSINKDQVWHTFLYVVSDQLGVRTDTLTPETRFAEDLNVD